MARQVGGLAAIGVREAAVDGAGEEAVAVSGVLGEVALAEVVQAGVGEYSARNSGLPADDLGTLLP